MAKLYLKFEQQVLKEISVGQGSVLTIGRLPDNGLQIDNLAVSGHHAKIYWDTDHFVVEDTHSLNGTYVNNQRVGKQPLKDADSVLIGKHTLVFKDEWHEDEQAAQLKPVMPALPKMEATVVLDTKKAKELLAQAKAASGAAAAAPARAEAKPVAVDTGRAPAPATTHTPAPAAAKPHTGTLTLVSGKADEARYVLSSKLTVIGGSDNASVKLKGSFFSSPPDVAAMISKRDERYFIAPQHKKANLRVNGEPVAQNHELAEGDVIEVWKVKLVFSFHE